MIAALREALLGITLLRIALWVALLGIALGITLRIALLGIALRIALLGITLRITLGVALLLTCAEIRESACASLLSLFGMLVEEIEVAVLSLIVCGLGICIRIEGIGSLNVEAVCKISGSAELGRLIIAAEKIGSCVCGNKACCGYCLIGREHYLTAAVVNAGIHEQRKSVVVGSEIAVVVERNEDKLLSYDLLCRDDRHDGYFFGWNVLNCALVYRYARNA